MPEAATVTTLDEGAFVRAAEAMIPTLKARIPLTRELRRVPDETIADLRAAGFFDLLKPRAWGGHEADPRTLYAVQANLGRGCPSTAWVMSVLAVHAWQLALFPEAAHHDVWSDDPDALIASSYAPTGRVEPVEGGFRVSGRWSFSSGCDHCSWIFLGGMVPPATPDGAPQMRTFLLPRADWRIEDNWHVTGLVGSGSKDIVVDGAFVPEHRTHKFIDGFTGRNPGRAVFDGPLFRLPFGQVFVRSVSSTILGVLEGALDAYTEVARSRVAASSGAKVSGEAVAQAACADAAATLDECKAVLDRAFAEMMDYARRDQPIPLQRRAQFRYESSRAVQRCCDAVDGLFTTAGGRAIFDGSEILRFFQDAHAIRAHFANKPEKPGLNFGGVMLGLDNADLFL